MAELLIIGLAADGPSDVALKLKDEREFLKVFGANFTQRSFLSPSATSLALNWTPWLIPSNTVNGRKDWLYYPRLNGNILEFGTIGGSGTNTVDVTFTPYFAEKDLIFAVRKYIEQTGRMPWVARVGGTRATLNYLGEWIFEAKHRGFKYNRVSITSDGVSGLVISGLEPNYPPLLYTSPDRDPEDFVTAISRDFELGLSPIRVKQSSLVWLDAGTYYLTGGEDGIFSESDFENLIEQINFPTEVSHVLVLDHLLPPMVDRIDELQRQMGEQPRLFFVQAPSFTSPATAFIQALYSIVPERHNMIASVLGSVVTNLDSKAADRFATEAAAIAFMKREAENISNLKLDANGFTPILTEEELDSLHSVGFMAPIRFIGNDISVYKGTNTLTNVSFLFSSKLAEIASIAKKYCFQFMGEILNDGDQPLIASNLNRLLSSIRYVTITSVSVVVRREKMYVDIEALLPGEILKISFNIRNR